MNKTKIIVVEDNIVYCEYVCNMLSREGYRNMKAYHLSTAKKHLQQATDNDIVVADLRLPDGSGIDLLCWMRKEGKMRLTERRKMEVNENRGRLCRKKLQGKIRKKKNHQKEKDITGSVKRANHNKGSMIVSDPTELVQPGGNNHSSRFVRLCVGACFIHGAG